jgi:hypothetical protein
LRFGQAVQAGHRVGHECHHFGNFEDQSIVHSDRMSPKW